jgi:uncharacterized repeat protein (TIGR04052 family)
MLRSIPSSLLVGLALGVGCGDDGSGSDEHDDHHETTSAESSTGSTTSLPSTSDTSVDDTSTTTSVDTTDSTGSTSASDSGSESSGTTGEAVTPVSISFGAFIGDEPFACGTTYEGVGVTAVTVEPRDLRFYVQDLQLLRASDGEPVPVVLDVDDPWQAETVALLDFEDASGACADGGGNPDLRTTITGTVPTDDYDGIAFTVGVPEDLNHGDPLFLPAPLGASSMTWGWLYGFKFIKVELQQVVEEGPAGDGVFHLGSNGCSGNPGDGSVECSLPNRAAVELAPFDWASQSVALDVGALFADTNLAIESQCHSFQPDVCPPVFERSGVDYDTGLPMPAQVVFSVQ